AARAHADPDRSEEVAGLVDEDQEREPDDGDEDVHAIWSAALCKWRAVAAERVIYASTFSLSSACRLASASFSIRSSRVAAGVPSTTPRVSSTTSAMPRNGSRPSRKAATAISFAAL